MRAFKFDAISVQRVEPLRIVPRAQTLGDHIPRQMPHPIDGRSPRAEPQGKRTLSGPRKKRMRRTGGIPLLASLADLCSNHIELDVDRPAGRIGAPTDSVERFQS